MISQRQFDPRQLVYWWLLLIGCSATRVGTAAYGFLVADAMLYAIGCLWRWLVYAPVAMALIVWRCIEPWAGWPGDSWRGLLQFGGVVLFSVCWYGAMIGSALWRVRLMRIAFRIVVVAGFVGVCLLALSVVIAMAAYVVAAYAAPDLAAVYVSQYYAHIVFAVAICLLICVCVGLFYWGCFRLIYDAGD